MALTTRHRWMLYGLAAVLTAAAMMSVQPGEDEDASGPAPVQPRRPGRTEGEPASVPELPRRSYGGAGRSPFGDTAAGPAASAPPEAFRQAPASPPPSPSVPGAGAAPETPYVYLGRWTEGGDTTVFLSHGDQRLAARAGRMLTAEYRVESIGERELRVFHVPTRSHRRLSLAAGGATPPATGAAVAAAPSEELN